MPPRTDDFVAVLQRRIFALESQVKTLQSAPRLRHASIDDAAVPIKGSDGRVKAILGRQSDGSHGDKVVESGPQPTPTRPILDPGAGTLSIEWDGRVVDGEVPQIFGRVEALAAPLVEGIRPLSTESRHLSSIYSAEGGATTIKATSGDWLVWLRMVGADGRTTSDLSEPVVASIDDTVDERTLRERIESALVGDLEDGLYDSLASRIARFIELEAESIRAYHLAFDALDGQTITGATFQTHHHPERGIKWTDEGAVGFDDEGRVTLWLDGEQNRLSGTFLMEGGAGAGDLAIRPFRAEEVFETEWGPDDIYTGIGFTDEGQGFLTSGLFVSPTGGLNLTAGTSSYSGGRPRGWMAGTWGAQTLYPRQTFEPDNTCRVGSIPIPMSLLNGWRTPVALAAEAPSYVRFGNMVFLRGAVLTPASGGNAQTIASLPAPSHVRVLSTSHATATGTPSPVTVQVSTSGALTVRNGGSLSATNVHLDGLFYYTS